MLDLDGKANTIEENDRIDCQLVWRDFKLEGLYCPVKRKIEYLYNRPAVGSLQTSAMPHSPPLVAIMSICGPYL